MNYEKVKIKNAIILMVCAFVFFLCPPILFGGTAPDLSDYTINAIPEGFIDISGTGTGLTINPGQGIAGIPIGFDFQFYGNSFFYLTIAAGGYISFDTLLSNQNTPFPSTVQPHNMIAPFWDSLDPSLNPGSGIYFTTTGTAPDRRCIIQWHMIPLAEDPGSRLTFELILFEQTNEIQFHYLSMVDGEGHETAGPVTGENASIGIENHDGTRGAEIGFHQEGAVFSHAAYSFTLQGNAFVRGRLLGDLNDDSTINILDQSLLTDVIVKKDSPYSSADLLLADIAPEPGTGDRAFGDGRIDGVDHQRLFDAIMGREVLNPVLSGLSFVTALPGESLSLYGSRFDSATGLNTVIFTNVNGDTLQVVPDYVNGDATELIVTIPAGFDFITSVMVQSHNHVSNKLFFLLEKSPVITLLDPPSGEEGDIIRIKGYEFGYGPADNSVLFNGIDAVVLSSASGSISDELMVVVPQGTATGPVTVTAHGQPSNPVLFSIDGPPVVELVSPSADTEITAPTEIIGTASDLYLTGYTLEYAPVGESVFTTISTGETSVVNAVLGTLDPTLLFNGLYTIRLTATDVEGNSSSVTETYLISGNMKVGIFSISFTDLSIPVSGIPITVTRTYDSRDRMHKGDFGYGWTMSTRGIKIEESCVPGEEWIQTQTGGGSILDPASFYLNETKDHTIVVTYPNGETEKFRFTISPSHQPFAPINYVTVSISPMEGTSSTLELTGTEGSDLLVYGNIDAPALLLDYDTNVFNPDTYRLTTVDGTVFIISQADGIQSITERNGNTITFEDNRITHSSGSAIQIERDGEGRIISMTDPADNSIHYTYDPSGDLVGVTDREGNVTGFVYNETHYLEEIIDPRGVQAVRNEYDESGRLVSTTDAKGHTITFEHDMDTRREVVTDRLGIVTVYEYDDKGNVITKIKNNLITRWEYDAHGNEIKEMLPDGSETEKEYDVEGRLLWKEDGLDRRTTYTYDSHGNLLSEEDADGNSTENVYDTHGNLIESYDKHGNLIGSYVYNSAGNMTSYTDARGITSHFTYDGNGNQTSAGFVWVNPEDPTETQLIENQFNYDDGGRILRSLDSEGNEVISSYDKTGNLLTSTDMYQHTTVYTYNSLNKQVEVLYPDGSVTRTVYDNLGQDIARVERQFPGEKSYGIVTTYDDEGKVIRIDNVEDIVIEIDSATSDSILVSGGSVISSISKVYNDNGLEETMTGIGGDTTTYEYDDAGRKTATINHLGERTEYDYDDAGQLISVTDALDNTTHYYYDALGREEKIEYADGTIIVREYDALGRRLSETDQAGKTKNFEYNDTGRLTAVVLPAVADPENGNTLVRPRYEYVYNPTGTLKTITDPKGRTTSFTYDALNRQLNRTLPMGQSESTEYDNFGRVIRKVDCKDQAVVQYYDDFGKVITREFYAQNSSSPDETIAYSYDDQGRLDTVTDSRGVTQYTYNDPGQLVLLSTPEGDIHYDYDPITKQKTRTWTEYTEVRYGYNILDRLSTVSTIKRNGIVLATPEVTTYGYNDVGSRDSVTLPNGVTTSYEYSDLNRLQTMTQVRGITTLASYTYQLFAHGQRTGVLENLRTADAVVLENGITYTYDALDRLTREVMEATDESYGYNTEYVYDLAGNCLERRVIAGTGELTTTYTYDANDRLISEQNTTTIAALPVMTGYTAAGIGTTVTGLRSLPAQWSWYGYILLMIVIPLGILIIGFLRIIFTKRQKQTGETAGQFGLRLCSKPVTFLIVYLFFIGFANFSAIAQEAALYSALSTKDWGTGDTVISYEYDANGLITRKTVSGSKTETTEYFYNLKNRLASVITTREEDSSIIVEEISYTYNFAGIRVGKNYTRRVDNSLVEEENRVYVVDPYNHTGYAQVLEELPAAGAAPVMSYTIGDDVISQAGADGIPEYLLYDGHGSTRQLADGSGDIVEVYGYDAYGVMLGGTPDRNSPAMTQLLYSGEQYDTDLGQYYLRARYYNQQNGRFNRLDPYPGNQYDPQSLHKYAYCHGDPVNKVDPSGMFTALSLVNAAAIIGICAVIGMGIGYGITGTKKGALWGAIAGGGVGLSITIGGPGGAVKAIFYGFLNALFTYLGIELAAKYALTDKPDSVTFKEMMVQAFASGAISAAFGGFLSKTSLNDAEALSAALVGALNSAITGYQSGQSFKAILINAAIGFLAAGLLAKFVMGAVPGIDDAAECVREVANAFISLAPSLMTASVMGLIKDVNPDLYNYITE